MYQREFGSSLALGYHASVFSVTEQRQTNKG